MLLWLEKSVEVPEGRLHVLIRWHLRKAHLEEDLTEFRPNLKRNLLKPVTQLCYLPCWAAISLRPLLTSFRLIDRTELGFQQE